MVSMPPELGETSHELSELSSLVKKIETAQLESRPLSSDEATALDVAFSKTNLRELCQAKLADSAKSELCSLAHRIWAAVGQGPPYDPLQDAKCRNLACNIFSASFRGCIPPSDALLLSAHWAFSGQAWMRADASSPLALPCFAEAAKAWRSQPSVKLAQVAAQALLWAGEAHFRQVSYIEAFSQLSQARDIICSYQDWDGMLDNFLRVCFEQANAHRAAGNLSEAIELLNLAIAAGPNAAPAAKCRLLRALALCHVSGVEGMAHAKQAFALSPTSKDRVLSLQVLLELLLGKESALETSKIQEAQVAALSLAKEPEASLSICLELCELLTERQLLEAVDSVLHALKLRNDISGQPDQCKVLLLYSLRNAAGAIIAAKSPGPGRERLNKVVADFEAVGETRTDSAKEICCDGGRLLWSLAGKLWNDGKKGDAARWIKKSAELLSAGQSLEAASCWLAAGKSFQLAGHMDSALACVRKAAADAILHLLELSCEQLKAGGESSEAWSCVEKLGKNPNLWRSQAARAAKATLEQPSEDLRLAGLELFVMCTAKDSQSDLSGLTMAAQLLKRMAELQRPVEDLRRLLCHAASVSAACGATLRQAFTDERPTLHALRQLLATAWSKGQEFGESLQWTSAALMFEAGHQILEILETVDPTAEGVDSARVRDFMDVRIWFLVMDASARVQQAKDPNDPESLRYALTCLQNAHRLRRQSQELQAKGIQGQVPCSSSTWCQRRFLIMVLLEFEVRCLLGGGSNAPLTQEGFARAAAWRDTEHVMTFITRVLVDLKGSVTDENELRSFAARSFRDGKPLLTISELRTGLKAARWIRFEMPWQAPESEIDAKMLLREGFPSTQLQCGDLVLVDERTRATVKFVDDPYVVVEYDELNEWASQRQAKVASASPREPRGNESLLPDSPKAAEVVHSTAGGKDNLAEDRIPKSRVSLRPKLPAVPQKYVPRQLAGEIYSMCIVIDDLKTLLCPIFSFWGDVLCWRRWDIALLMFFLLMLTSVASTMAFLLECCIDSSGAQIAKATVRSIMLAIKILLALAVFGIFLRRARWFVPMRSLFRTCWRYLFHRRLAPKIWPFFRGTGETPASP